MNVQFYFEKLHSSNEFKKFIKENPSSYLCSGFFLIDKEEIKKPNNKVYLDFYVPKKKKVFSFDIKEEIKLSQLENFGKIPSKISENCEFNFEEVEKIILEEMEKQNVKSKIKKIIFSLQNLKGKDFLIVIVFISMLGIIKININISNKKITKFEKKSLMDMFKIMSK